MFDLGDGDQVQSVVVAELHIGDDGFGFEFRQHLPGVEEAAHQHHDEAGLRQGVETGLRGRLLRPDEQYRHALRASAGHAAFSIKFRANSESAIYGMKFGEIAPDGRSSVNTIVKPMRGASFR
jgi:hypothetical protein